MCSATTTARHNSHPPTHFLAGLLESSDTAQPTNPPARPPAQLSAFGTCARIKLPIQLTSVPPGGVPCYLRCVSCGGGFQVGLASPGEVNIDYVYLQPGAWGRYKVKTPHSCTGAFLV